MTTGTSYDVVVLGGGLLGAAAARDAALRGLSTALFAPEEFGVDDGRHSRLALGSLGALETLDFTRVREDCREREILRLTAPSFVRAVPVLIPFYSPGLLAQTRLRASLALADALGFDPLQHFDSALPPFDPFQRVHQILSAAQARRRVPGLCRDGLSGAARVWEACVENPARLAWATALDAERQGAALSAHTSVTEIMRHTGPSNRVRVTGIVWKDTLTGATGRTSASLVIVTDPHRFPSLFPPDFPPLFPGQAAVPLLRSVSLRVPGPAETDPDRWEPADALALPGSDGALRFVVPGPTGSVLGPWETDCFPECPPVAGTAGEIAGRLESLHPFLPGLSAEAVLSAEVRVRASVAPGREVCDPAGEGRSLDGLLLVSGGTLTTARRLAEDAIDLACRKLGRSLAVPPCRTALTPLPPVS